MTSNDRPRSGRGRFTRSIDTAQRDADACRLRTRGATYQQIADQLGYANRGDAHHAVSRALKAAVAEPADEVRALELARLDAMYEAAMGVLERRHVTVSNGRVITLDNEPLEDDAPVLQAIDRLLRIQARRAALLGLDAEKKVNLSGGVRYEVVGIDPADLG